MIEFIMDNSLLFILIGIIGSMIAILVDRYNGKVGLTDELLVRQYVKLIRRRNKLLTMEKNFNENK